MLTVVKERRSANVQPKEMINPVENLWSVELLYGKHHAYTELTYAVNFTTKLEGGASKCFLVIDLLEKFEEYLRDLNVFGALERSEFHAVIDYIKYLKVNGIFKRVPNLLSELEGSSGKEESLELFEALEDGILSDLDAFPSISSDAYQHGVSAGVVLDTEQYIEKYGMNVVGVTAEFLYEALSLDGSTKNVRLQEIVRGWKSEGQLLVKNKQARLQEPIKPNLSSKEVKRFYIFKIDGLGLV